MLPGNSEHYHQPRRDLCFEQPVSTRDLPLPFLLSDHARRLGTGTSANPHQRLISTTKRPRRGEHAFTRAVLAGITSFASDAKGTIVGVCSRLTRFASGSRPANGERTSGTAMRVMWRAIEQDSNSLVGLLTRLAEQTSPRVRSRSVRPRITAKALTSDPDRSGRTIGGPALLRIRGPRIRRRILRTIAARSPIEIGVRIRRALGTRDRAVVGRDAASGADLTRIRSTRRESAGITGLTFVPPKFVARWTLLVLSASRGQSE